MLLYNYYFKTDAVLIFLLPTAYTEATSKYQQGVKGKKKEKEYKSHVIGTPKNPDGIGKGGRCSEPLRLPVEESTISFKRGNI